MKIPFTSILQPIKDVAERNAMYATLTPEQRRKEIAYDALMLLVKGAVTASSCDYWNHTMRHAILETDSLNKRPLKYNSQQFQQRTIAATEQPVEDCRVCQRGALMLSRIRLGNSINNTDTSLNDIVDGTCLLYEEAESFSSKSLYKLENAFEYGYNINYYNTPRDGFKTEYEAYLKYKTVRMANIFCLVIDKGDFVPDADRDYLTEWEITIN